MTDAALRERVRYSLFALSGQHGDELDLQWNGDERDLFSPHLNSHLWRGLPGHARGGFSPVLLISDISSLLSTVERDLSP